MLLRKEYNMSLLDIAILLYLRLNFYTISSFAYDSVLP